MNTQTLDASVPDSPLDLLEDLNSDLALTSSSSLSLDDLLAESMAEKTAADNVRAARQVVAKGGLSAQEKEAMTASIRSWEARREWNPAAAVVIFSRQQCTCCGEFSCQFMGFFQRQQHRQTRVDRWIASVMPRDEKLPRESKYQDSQVELCENCAEHLGFDVEES